MKRSRQVDGSAVTTRDATPDDIPHLIRMISALASHHGDDASLDAKTLAADLFGPAPWIYALVAEVDGTPIGYAALCPLMQLQFGARGMDMHHLFVDAGFRGCGVGKTLIDAAQTRAKGLGCRYMTVSTHPDNTDAQKVYLACGFEARTHIVPRFAIRIE